MAIRRILLTGAQGFVGSRLVLPLERAGYQVRCQDLFGTFRPNSISGDLCAPTIAQTAVRDIDVVVHLAGGKPQASQVYQNNVSSTSALIQACLTEKVQRFVFASTINVQGHGPFCPTPTVHDPPYFPIDEHQVACPEDDYSRSKLEGERILRYACETSSMCSLALRLPGLWGPEFTDSYLPDDNCVFSPLQVVDPWHYLDLRDLAEAILRYLELAAPPPFAVGYLTAPDLAGTPTTQEHLEAAIPTWLELWRTPPVGHQPLFCSKTVTELLEWTPHHLWRKLPAWRRRLNRLRRWL